MGAADEIVTIVDEQNNLVGAVPRREMRARNLPHRSTYILVFNSRGALYVQKRTLTKDVFPGYYDVAAGGVVLAGESYEQGARRELEEEMGIRDVPLTWLFDFYFADEHARVWGGAYRRHSPPGRDRAVHAGWIVRPTTVPRYTVIAM